MFLGSAITSWARDINHSTSIILCSLLSITLLGGCAGVGAQYSPVVDGPRDQLFTTDLQQCQALAKSQPYINPRIKTDALIGGVIGGLAGIADDGIGGAAAGAAIGAGLGAVQSSYNELDERKNIIIRCMQGRGHNVVG
ncbi:MAG: glycine zipper family protein [Rhodospirillaceae bacterium]|nr:glycine zipper family protein [Rhodospirillaceae bacterium]|tara:strand:+ start:971 stop:1387 length:417 start_codon:yes stop_codon:yes gene_type:complete